jgi:hypothetical protein
VNPDPNATEPVPYDPAEELGTEKYAALKLKELVSATNRMATALERIADGVWGTKDTTGLLQLLNPLDVRNLY